MKIIKNPEKGILFIKTQLGSISIQEGIDFDKKKIVIFRIKKKNDCNVILEGIGTTITILREIK